MKERLKKVSKNWSLNRKLQVLFGIILVLNLLFLAGFSMYYRADMTEYAMEKDQKLVQSSVDVMDAELQSVNNMSRIIMLNTYVRNYLSAPKEKVRSAYIKALDDLYNCVIQWDYISSIYIIRPDGQKISLQMTLTYMDQDVITGDNWMADLDEKKGKPLLRYGGNGAFSLINGAPLISYMRAVYDVDTQEKIGYLAINLRADFFEDTINSLLEEPGGEALIMDSWGHVLVDTGMPEKLKKKVISEKSDWQDLYREKRKRYIITEKSIPKWDLKIASLRKNDYTAKHYSGLFTIVLIYIAISILSLMTVNFFVRRKITKPIRKLVTSMDQVRDGWLHRVSMKTDNDEIGKLKDSYNTMLVEINNLLKSLVEKEKEEYRLELDVLHEQIKPHFLYNTLYTIEYMALQNKDMKTFESLQTLGRFYKNFLSKGSREIPVSREVQIISDYLKLQSLRYADILTTDIQVDEEAACCYILKLSLQPLVENCIYHGIRPKGELCEIAIHIWCEKNRVMISVKDTGVGMPEDKIQSILSGEKSRSFGLKATIKRLELFYERNDICSIQSEEGEYTEILLKIPMKKEASSDEENQSHAG